MEQQEQVVSYIKEANSLAAKQAHQELLAIPSIVLSYSTATTTTTLLPFYNIYLLKS